MMMNRLLRLALFVPLLGISPWAQAGWNHQPTGTTRNLFDLQFLDPDRGWVVGDSGTLMKSTNGGALWADRSLNTAKALRAIHFKNADTGWIAGDSGLLLNTSDGGASWKAQSSNTHHHLRRIQFLSPDTGWVLGDSGRALRTLDGGRTWLQQAEWHVDPGSQYSTTRYDLLCGDFATPMLGLVCSTDGHVSGNNPSIYRTRNGGASWQLWMSGAFRGGDGFTGFSFVSDSVGFFFHTNTTPCTLPRCLPEYRPALFKTWGPVDSIREVSIPVLPQLSRLNSAAFATSAKGWIVGNEYRGGGYILKTGNGGESWSKETGTATSPLAGLHVLDSNRVWAFGNAGLILATTQGGGEIPTSLGAARIKTIPAIRACVSNVCRYEIAATGKVQISLFDTKGAFLGMLVNETLAPGGYTLDLSERGLAGGLYVLGFSHAGAFRQTRKVLIR